jgi:hypothetical protein
MSRENKTTVIEKPNSILRRVLNGAAAVDGNETIVCQYDDVWSVAE